MLHRRFGEIIDAFMSAPLDVAGWDAALRKMARATGSAHGQLVAFGHDHAIPFSRVTDEPEGWTEDFIAIDGGNPAVNWRVACARAPFEVVFEQDYAAIRRKLKSDIYDDFAQRHDMMHGCQAVLSHDRFGFFGLATLRSASDGPTTEDQRALFARLLPFVLSAVKMQIALEHKGSQLAANAFDSLGVIAFLLDGRGKVAALTNVADEFLRRPDCPLRLPEGHLAALRPDDDRSLQQGIGRALKNLRGELSRLWLAAPRKFDGQVCEVFPLPVRQWAFGYEPRVLIVVREIGRARPGQEAFLRHVMGLTAAEAEVAALIGEGLSREQVAERRGTSAATVHAQLKSLFAKAEVSREAELVALINRLLA